MTTDALDVRITIDHEHIQANQDTVMHVIADLEAPSGMEQSRAPLTVVIVLDVSTSMEGAPLDHVKAATTRLLEVLGPEDRAGVVTFSTEAHLVAPVRTRDAAALAEVKRQVTRLRTEGVTNIQAGIELAREVLPARRAHERQVLLVLSDGQPNRGYATPMALGHLAKTMRPEVSISTLGFGEHHDERVLTAIAESGSGAYFYIPDPHLCYAQFAAALGAQADIAIEDVRLTIVGAEGVDVLRVGQGDAATIAIPDLVAHARHRVVIRLRVRGRRSPGSQTIGSLAMRYRRIGDKEYTETTRTIDVTVKDVPSIMNRDGLRAVLVMRCAEERRSARGLADRGDFAAAARSLREAARIVAQVPGFSATDGSQLSEAYDQLLDDADLYDQSPDQRGYQAFLRGQRFGVGGDVDAGAYQPAGARSQQLVDDAAGPLPRAALFDQQLRVAIPLDKARIVLGRSRTCDICVPSAKVSRQSATLTAVSGRFRIQDLGSANGVWMNGQKIQDEALRNGDTFTIGDHDFVYVET